MMQSIINYKAIKAAKVAQIPYPFFSVNDALCLSSCRALLNDFPSSNHGGSLPLESVEIKGAMACLIEEIKGDQFRQLMAEKFSVDLSDKPIVITARGYSRQKDGQVHTDSKTKLITILLYFNDGWESESGRLRMLNSNNINDYAAEFSSAIGQMVAFKVTDNCWHGYNSFDGQRQSLQINYLVEEKYTKHHVYRHKVSAWFKNMFHRKA
ncbi:2OG-Fe(II) oxygenase [Eionea flava]